MRDPVVITQRADYLKKVYSAQKWQYQINRWAYDGEWDKIAANGKVPLGWGGLDNRRRRDYAIQNWNVLKPLVDFTVIQLCRLPTINVPNPAYGDESALAAGKAKATIVENFIYWLWDQSSMSSRHMELSWNIGCLGSAVHQLVVDFEREIVYFTERDPAHCYPMPKGDGQSFAYVCFCWSEDAELLATQYPRLRDAFPRKGNKYARVVDVIEYHDANDSGFLLDGNYHDSLAGYKHDLGFVPVTVTPAIKRTGSATIFGPSDIDQLIGTNMLLNVLQTKIYDALEENLYPRIYTIGDEEPLIDNAPGTANYLGPPGSDVKMLNPPSIPREAWAEYDRFMEHTRVHGNWSEVWSGMLDQSQASGQAVRRLQSPAMGMSGIRQDLLSQDMRQMNIYWLKMMVHFFGKKTYDCVSAGDHGPLRAVGRAGGFSQKVTPADDVGDYQRNDVNYSVFGADVNSTMTTVQQLGQNGFISKEFGMRLIPGITDEKAMKEEIRAERREEIEFEAELQQRLSDIETKAFIKQQEAMAQARGAAAGAQAGNGVPGNVSVLGQGQPQVMGVGQALSTDAEQVGGLPYTNLKPFGQALNSLTQGGQPQEQPAQEQPQGITKEVEPAQVRAEDVVSAVQGIADRVANGEIRSRSGGLKGDVYLMGDLATRGSTMGNIELGVTVAGDGQLLTNALTQWRGRLTIKTLTAPLPAGRGKLIVKGGQNAVSENTQAA